MSEYEFSDSQNQSFDQLANALQRFAIIFGVWGASFVIMAVLDMSMAALGIEGGSQNHAGAAVSVVTGVACVIIALMMLKPVKNFRRITTTSGKDISELLGALAHLNASHGYLRLVLAILFVGSLIGMFALL